MKCNTFAFSLCFKNLHSILWYGWSIGCIPILRYISVIAYQISRVSSKSQKYINQILLKLWCFKWHHLKVFLHTLLSHNTLSLLLLLICQGEWLESVEETIHYLFLLLCPHILHILCWCNLLWFCYIIQQVWVVLTVSFLYSPIFWMQHYSYLPGLCRLYKVLLLHTPHL